MTTYEVQTSFGNVFQSGKAILTCDNDGAFIVKRTAEDFVGVSLQHLLTGA